ncbi:MAG: hypothetical protein U0836_14550 [Pirellulales bacterium]
MKSAFPLRTFSLRTLLVGSALAALGLALLGNNWAERRRQEWLWN